MILTGDVQVPLTLALSGYPNATKTMTPHLNFYYPPSPAQIPLKSLPGQLVMNFSLPHFTKRAQLLADLMEEQLKGVLSVHIMLLHFCSKQTLLGYGEDSVLQDKLGLGKKKKENQAN